MATRAAETEIAGVRLTSPARVLYPEQGVTKKDLALYFQAVAEWILPHLAGRPLSLVRCPRGEGAECFFQKHAAESFPRFIRRVEVEEENTTVTYPVVESLPGLVYMAQIGTLELHTAGTRRDRIDRPDRLILDLDPDADLGWSRVVEAAREVRERLDTLGLRSFVKTTGGKGLHVVAPLLRRHSWEELKEFARAVAAALAADRPDRYTVQSSKAERAGKVFLDYLRNTRGASAVAAYSPRARAGAPVSTPIRWEELDSEIRSDSFTIRNLQERLANLTQDPWAEYGQLRQGITKRARRELGLEALTP